MSKLVLGNGSSDLMMFPLQLHAIESETKHKLEAHVRSGNPFHPKSGSENEICCINRNPADFTVPEAGNIYMIRGEDLKFGREASSSGNGMIKSVGHKRQRKLSVRKEHSRNRTSWECYHFKYAGNIAEPLLYCVLFSSFLFFLVQTNLFQKPRSLHSRFFNFKKWKQNPGEEGHSSKLIVSLYLEQWSLSRPELVLKHLPGQNIYHFKLWLRQVPWWWWWYTISLLLKYLTKYLISVRN